MRERIEKLVEEAAAAQKRGAHGEAVAHFQELVTLWPAAACFNNLGLALSRDARLADAEAAFREAVTREPSAAAYTNLGNALRRQGNKAEAVAAYESALALNPETAAAHYNLHAALYDDQNPEPAIAALSRSVALRPDHFDTRFYLGALRLLHQNDDTLIAALPEVCDFLVTSLRYLLEHRSSDTRLFADTFDTLRHAFSRTPKSGLVVELGVRRGTTLRLLADLAHPAQVHGFDAFEGLPEAWGEQERGLYSTGGELPEVPPNATLHPGWFRDTLPPFAAAHSDPLRLLHVDCDIYTSTRTALDTLARKLAPGTVIVFDEYLCNPGWENEEHKAWREQDVSYEYVAFSLFTKQAVVRVKTDG